MEDHSIRLNKYISDAGVCSRRAADEIIEAGRVKVDGKTAVTGMKILPCQEVIVDGKIINPVRKKVIIAVNKPVGVICTSEKRKGTVNIDDFMNRIRKNDPEFPTERLFSIGRLDKDSEGLLLMTNNGDIVNEIMRSRNGHEKEYKVTLDKEVTDEFIEKMSQGVEITIGEGSNAKKVMTKPCEVWKIGKYTIGIILTQGLNRQIRKMCEAFGYRVKTLFRVRIMNIRIDALKPGMWRYLTADEEKELFGSF